MKFNAQAKAEMANAPQKTPEAKYAAARSNLLLVVAFSVVNLVLMLVKADIYFLFSATFPQVVVSIGEVCAEILAMPSLYGVGIGLAVVSVVLYFLCWLFSKKNYGWMLASAVLFGLDCVLLLFFLDVEMIIDIAFHVLVMYYLISGVVAGNKLKNQPPQPELPVEQAPVSGDSPADTDVVMLNGEPVKMESAQEN